MSLNEFEFGNALGKGAYSSVHVVKRKADGKTYAMKRVQISQLNTKERENALNEIRLLASLSHVNIIGYKEAFFDEISQTMNIVMELADDGDILSKIKSYTQPNQYFRESTIWPILVQILQGLKYLHDNHIMHRDLKSANVFLMKNGIVKIGDLNVSKIAKLGMASTQIGTPFYASPEVWMDRPYDYKSDVWSIGCIVYEMCTLKTPFRGQTLTAVFSSVQKGSYDPIPYIYSKELGKVITHMLQVNPSSRLTCDQLLKTDLIGEKMKDSQQLNHFNHHHNHHQENDSQMDSRVELIKTIKIPKNLREINKALPTRQYGTANERIQKSYDDNDTSKNANCQMKKRNVTIDSLTKKRTKTSIPRQVCQTEGNRSPILVSGKKHKAIPKDKGQSQRQQLKGHHGIRIVYCKPILTHLNQIEGPPQSKITEYSPIRNKVLPCQILKKKAVTPIRLSKNKNVSPIQHTKSTKGKISRPVSSISNDRRQRGLVSPNSIKKITKASTLYDGREANNKFIGGVKR